MIIFHCNHQRLTLVLGVDFSHHQSLGLLPYVWWITNQIDYILCIQRWRSSIQSAKTRLGADCGSDYELLIGKFRLKLKKVGKTTRPFRYDLNKIPYDYTVEVRNRFKGLDLIDRVPDEDSLQKCKQRSENQQYLTHYASLYKNKSIILKYLKIHSDIFLFTFVHFQIFQTPEHWRYNCSVLTKQRKSWNSNYHRLLLIVKYTPNS